MKLSYSDMKAIDDNNSAYLFEKGLKLYNEGEYNKAIEYYRLSAALGNSIAVSKLAYCYKLGRNVEKDINLAHGYFALASRLGNIESTYELGNIYKDKGDNEACAYYYAKAISYINEFEHKNKVNIKTNFPFIYHAISKELMPGGIMNVNLFDAFNFLLIAQDGYEQGINNGNKDYEPLLMEVNKLLTNKIFKHIREMYEKEECDCECDE